MLMLRKILVLTVLVTVLAGCGSESGTNDQAPDYTPPNFLFAISDDQSFPHAGAYGTAWIKTPAFDRVAREGILFNRAYTPNAKCAPSRTCILTGRNSWQLEEAANHVPYFPEKFKTFAEVLREQGYTVGMTAKGWAPGVAEINGQPRQLIGPSFNDHKLTPPAQHISNNDYAENFRSFLDSREQGKPFFFWYGSTEPHRAYEFGAGINKGGKKLSDIDEVPPFWPDIDSVRTDMLDYAFEIEHFDQHLQKMLTLLEEQGLLSNTVVIVTADNGMPFPRVKGQMYERDNHLPLAIMWPDGIQKPGRKVNDFVSFIDFAPTFLELAGISQAESGMQPITGRSLTDILFSEKEGVVNPNRDHTLIGKERHDVGRPNDQGYPVRGIVRGDFLYTENFKPDRWPAGNPETGYLNCDGSPTKTVLLDRRNTEAHQFWQLSFGKRSPEELYNITDDPYCMNNLADRPELAEQKAQLKELLYAELKAQGDPRILGAGDIFDQYEYANEATRNFYERYMAGEEMKAGWVNKTDFDSRQERQLMD